MIFSMFYLAGNNRHISFPSLHLKALSCKECKLFKNIFSLLDLGIHILKETYYVVLSEWFAGFTTVPLKHECGQ